MDPYLGKEKVDMIRRMWQWRNGGSGLFAAAVAGAIGLGATSVSAQNLVVHWTFDEDSGDALDQAAPPATDGVLGSTAMRSDDTPGGSPGFSLDLSAPGTQSIVDGGDSAEVDTLEKFTMSTWMKVEGLNADQGGSGNVRLLAKQADTPLFDGFSWNINTPNDGERSIDNFRLGMFIGGEIDFGFGVSAGPEEDPGAGDIEDKGNQWIFVAVTYDGSVTEQNMKFFLGDENNPVQQLGETADVGAGALFSSSGLADFGIGFTDAAPGLDFSINGKQDDVRVYDDVLDLEALEAVRSSILPAAVTGDADGDGDVDAFDLGIWQTQFGQTGDGLSADFDSDGDVDAFDLGLWQTNFGTGQSAAVPEPASLALLGLGVVATLRRRR